MVTTIQSVVRARLDRFRDGLLVLFVGVVGLGAAGALNFLAIILVTDRGAPVVLLAGGTKTYLGRPAMD